METIMVVDDIANVREMLEDFLGEQGYRVVTAENGQDALEVSRKEKPNLVLLDVMMPQMDGLSFLPTYRRESAVPVILLTARMEETDKVIGLGLGADDYVTKPFGLRELLARVRAQLRRSREPWRESKQIWVGEIVLDKETRVVRVGERVVSLTPTEFELLVCLMQAPGRVFARGELLDALGAHALAERTVDVHVRNLRAKMEEDPTLPRWIETVHSMGYRMNGDLRAEEE